MCVVGRSLAKDMYEYMYVVCVSSLLHRRAQLDVQNACAAEDSCC